MRKVLVLGSMAVCLLMLLATALVNYLGAEYGEQRVLRRALEAHGGAEAIRRIKAGHLQGEGVRYRFHGPDPFTWEEWFQTPDRYKLVMRDRRATAYYVAPPRKWWIVEPGLSPKVMDLGEVHPTSQFEWLRRLDEIERWKLPVRAGAEEEVLFRPALGLLVSSDQWGQVTLSFDKAKGILVRARGQVDQAKSGPFTNDYIYSQHREVNGVLLPMKATIFVNGERSTEMTITAVELVDQLDPAIFSPP